MDLQTLDLRGDRSSRAVERFIVGFRWLVFILAALTREPSRWSSATTLVFGLAALVTVFLTLGTYGRSRRLGRWTKVLWPPTVTLDLLAISLLVYDTGGLKSEYYHSYALVLLQVGILFGVRSAALTTAAAGLLYFAAASLAAGSTDVISRVAIRTTYLAFTAAIGNHLARQERRAVLLALTDDKTGLPNSRFFHQWLERCLSQARQHRTPVTVAIIDVDNFKALNFAIGHLAADTVLEQLAKRIQQLVPQASMVARYGGEEFTFALMGPPTERTVQALDSLRRALADHPFGTEGEPVHLTVSIGVASYPEDGQTVRQLLARADSLLYAAKDAGRNQLCSRLAGR